MNKITKTLSTVSTGISMFLVSPASVFAQENLNLKLGSTSQFSNVASWTGTSLLSALVNLILIGASLAAFIFLLIGGFQWITAGGDKEGTDKARKRITAALIGLVITFSAYAIITLAGNFLGVNLLQLNFITIAPAA